jgi:hypothetical protein
MATYARERRPYRQIFLDTLTNLSGDQQTFVGNIRLRQELDWDPERYDRIKWQLLNEEAILLGRGQGGSVCLATAPGTNALKVFVSYSHADETLKNQLVAHLKPLEHAGLIALWHDLKLNAGDEWDAMVARNLDEADIILLLISVDFINSKYCYERELERALERHTAQQTTVVPIILRSCMWSNTPFSTLQALPKEGKAVTAWPDKDEAFLSVAEGLRRVVDDLSKRQ